MTKAEIAVVAVCGVMLWALAPGCTSETNSVTCVSPDATYIAIVESNPPIHGEIRRTDTLRLVFDYNIDSYDYSAASVYTFCPWYKSSPNSRASTAFDGALRTADGPRGRITASLDLSKIERYADTIIDPIVLFIRIVEEHDGEEEIICTKLLEYRLLRE